MASYRASRESVWGSLFAGLFCMFWSQCPSTPVVNLPPAQLPVLETILDVDHNSIAPFGPPGVFQMASGQRIELRLRLPYPSNAGVGIGTSRLTEVTDTAAHPELDGYFHVQNVTAVDNTDPLFFYRVLVVLPQAQQGTVDYKLRVYDTSQNQSLTGVDKEQWVELPILRNPNPVPQPSVALYQDVMVPDQKHPRKVDTNQNDKSWIADNLTLAGWLIDTPDPVTGYNGEDLHYSIWLDNDFIERNYGPTTNGLNNAVVPGRWWTELDNNTVHPKMPVSLTAGQQPNAGTFMLPGKDEFTVEMNAWHIPLHNTAAPAGWISIPSLSQVAWPFEPQKTFDLSSNLQEGDYVIVSGAFVQNSAELHTHDGDTQFRGEIPYNEFWERQCWENHYRGQGGWLEIHPVDSVRRVQGPVVRKQTQLVTVCDDGGGKTLNFVDVRVPLVPVAPTGTRADYQQVAFKELIDNRFTDMNSVTRHVTEVDACDPTKLHIAVTVQPQGHFKAVYLVWWQDSQTKRPAPVCPPPNVKQPDDLPVCSRKPDLPQCKNPAKD